MTRYRIEDKVVDTAKASHRISLPMRAVGYGHDRGDLYRSARGRWYRVHDYDWIEDGRTIDHAEWVSPEEAARLILCAGQELPDYPELRLAALDVCE